MTRSSEPKALLRGKRFHKRIQDAWHDPKDTSFGVEKPVAIEYPPELAHLKRSGRMDVFFDLPDASGVAVFEIKATNWDNVKHRRRVLSSHKRQVMKYVDQYLMHRDVNVCAIVVYPRRPRCSRIVKEVQDYMDDASIMIQWFDDATATTEPR